MPNYLISWSTDKVVLRNYEGVITTYKEPESYESIYKNVKAEEISGRLEEAKEHKAIGIASLLSNMDDTISEGKNNTLQKLKEIRTTIDLTASSS